MEFSVAYNFAPGLIAGLAAIAGVREIYGKLASDITGGGRSSYTLRPVSLRKLTDSISEAHQYGLTFNYLLNGSDTGGLEQTRLGQKKIRRFLDVLSNIGVDSLTVANPFLLRLIVKHYRNFDTRVSAFARIAHPDAARYWEEMGAKTLCISAIAANRDLELLTRIRKSVSCQLQLIVNASCIPHCSHELTHMNLLTRSSRKGDPLKGFCLDYCFLHCSAQRIKNPVYFIRSSWIRPEDLIHYERIGYSHFKIVERSSTRELLIRRTRAYSERSFDGNLLELVGPVAALTRQQGATFGQRMRMYLMMLRPRYIKTASLRKILNFARMVIFTEYSREQAPVYISNKRLDGFLENLVPKDCTHRNCRDCMYCENVARGAVEIQPEYRNKVLDMANELDSAMLNGSLW